MNDIHISSSKILSIMLGKIIYTNWLISLFQFKKKKNQFKRNCSENLFHNRFYCCQVTNIAGGDSNEMPILMNKQQRHRTNLK